MSSTEDERCELTDLIKSQCAHCRKDKTPEEEQMEIDQAFMTNIKSWLP